MRRSAPIVAIMGMKSMNAPTTSTSSPRTKETSSMNKVQSHISYQPRRLARRSFLRRLGLGAALLAPGAALLSSPRKIFAEDNRHLKRGDVAILQFLAAAE